MNYLGFVIARERLRKNWSQEGLCKGICTVSYLSKIESGKARPSDQVLGLLLERLALKHDAQTEAEAEALVRQGFELLFTLRLDRLQALLENCGLPRFRAAEAGLALETLYAAQITHEPLDAALEPLMDTRSLALQRILQARAGEALLLCPNAYTHLMAGIQAYEGGNFSQAIDVLQTAYEMAAREGAARLMLECKLFIGNSYCNQQDLPNMERHYQAARRLAEDLMDQRSQYAIDYNTASVWIEVGRYADAYAWFSRQEALGLMALHKLAICCEKLGKRSEGLSALDRAEALETDEMEQSLARQICALVRYRLEHADYLEQEAYGELLLACFARCRAELAAGYAVFHLPWVLEWYKATRQYKRACELLENFPGK